MTLKTPSEHQPKKIAVLISGNGSNLQAIIDDQQKHPQLYRIALVVSNRPNAYGLKRAAQAGIPTLVIDHTNYSDRESFDAELQRQLDQSEVDLIVLAGFMRILTQGFTQHFLGKMLNIHPSLLPKYTGLNTHQRAIDAGDSEHGLSIHFVTPELDGGPVILQDKVLIEPGESADSLQQKIHQREHIAYPLAVRWFCEGKIALQDNRVQYQQKTLQEPLQLNESRDL
ncbi:phosphoribosylglycinamide formyltransferase [Thiomicrorhabdus xiamenensis]|uniref:Phosphoribosylglycinamide formyltransferase n=1 Tax=Thiomicrorhabdus xiamenensis TaxID=2739063 RepID=A0A7D4T0W3_9GAMM|nr:phosphoribosylglycinamide formyltransferase [Thiomicrorhabdus xiamenensis]QKI89462.1 phosphoribosylglycinamide formyltransferase [Thiomicrorhabdus xiamenensis]